MVAEQGGAILDKIMDGAVRSKTQTEDAVTFKEFIEEVAQNSPVRNVYIPSEAVAEYMQSEEYEDGELARFEEQIAEGQESVAIPIADAVAHLAGTKAWEALKDSARVTPDGISRKEAEQRRPELYQQLEEQGKALAEEAKAAGIEADAIAEVKDEIKNQLLAAGVGSKEAEMVATYQANMSATTAARAKDGSTPMEAWRRLNTAFQGVDDTTGKVTGGRALAQQAFEGLIAANTNDPAAASENMRTQIEEANRMADTVYSAWERGEYTPNIEQLNNLIETQERAFAKGEIPDDLRATAEGTLAFLRNMRGTGTNLFQSTRETLPEKIDIDGVERWTVNSNGQPIARDEAGVRAFWEWFGDSKVVDAEGRPLVMHHASGNPEEIREFKTERMRPNDYDAPFNGSGLATARALCQRSSRETRSSPYISRPTIPRLLKCSTTAKCAAIGMPKREPLVKVTRCVAA